MRIPRGAADRLSAAFALLSIGLACAKSEVVTTPRPTLPFATDSLVEKGLRPGITRRFIYSRTGPWAIHVMDVDLDRCNRAVAVKRTRSAIGRDKTSVLLKQLSSSREVIGGVNADFFSLTAPAGVPTGALVTGRRVLAGPSQQPVLAFDEAGTAHILTLSATGFATIGAGQLPIEAWNRNAPNGLALFDRNWSTTTDTASAVIEVVLSGGDPRRVVRVDTARTGVDIPQGGVVLIAGRNTPAATRSRLLALRDSDTVRTSVVLFPMHPRDAVGGRPQLLRDSTILGVVDTEGQPGFATGRHPRTAAGISNNGRRLFLVVVDGRQAPYSDGMTLRELANLMLALGARDAINLDGGGSTTFVYSPRDSSRVLRLANRPSDPTGERTVGDALAIVDACR